MKTEHTISRQVSAARAAWCAADETYRRELLRVYEEEMARADEIAHADPAVIAARDAAHAACAAWRAKVAAVQAEYPAAEAALVAIFKRLMP